LLVLRLVSYFNSTDQQEAEVYGGATKLLQVSLYITAADIKLDLIFSRESYLMNLNLVDCLEF
jgi:hypothetical protein